VSFLESEIFAHWCKYVNGDTYDGVFIEGYRPGKGTYVFKKNGDKYEGFYEENKKHGFGKMVYTSKSGKEEEDGDDEEESVSGHDDH